MSTAPGSGASHGDANEPINRLSQDVNEIVREELMRIRKEWSGTVRGAGIAGTLLAGGVLTGLMALNSASTTALRLFESFMPPRRAAAALTIVQLLAAGVLTGLGIERLQAATGSTRLISQEIRRALLAPARSAATRRRHGYR